MSEIEIDAMARKLIISFNGEIARQGRVPSFTAFDSLTGLAQAMTMTSHFASTGEIRRRNFKDIEPSFYFSDTREGSFEIVLDVVLWTGGVVAGGLLWDFLKSTMESAIGGEPEPKIKALEKNGDLNSGDYGALIQAIEPSLRRGHNIINHGANQINIFMDASKTDRVVFDNNTKEYLYDDVFNTSIRLQNFLVTSFDGRQRTGRLFNLELEQAFTFELRAEADNKSLEVIADAARAYALRRLVTNQELEIACAFDSIDAPDGRMKRLRVYVARDSISDINGVPNGKP